jgi:hypothetical protein
VALKYYVEAEGEIRWLNEVGKTLLGGYDREYKKGTHGRR